jgi:hypothetical protein
LLLVRRPTTAECQQRRREIIQCHWSGDPPEADKLRQRRTSYARGGQVTPKAHKSNNGKGGQVQQRQRNKEAGAPI